MAHVLELLVIGTVTASLCAFAAYAVVSLWSNRQGGHWLWGVVLLKFVVPGVFLIPVSVPVFEAISSEWDTCFAEFGTGRASADSSASVTPEAGTGVARADASAVEPSDSATHMPESVASTTRRQDAGRPDAAGTFDALALGAICLWGFGSFLMATFVARRVVRFVIAARETLPISEKLRDQAAAVARRMGLKKCPEIRLINAQLPPVMWCAGTGPVVLLPLDLVRELDEQQIAGVLAHEFAHVRRRDHWLVWLEVAAIVLNWRNPIAWWAVRQRRQMAELCCDAMVVEAMPNVRLAYCDALLQSAELVHAVPKTPMMVATAFGEFNSLKRRIEMILESQNAPKVRRSTCAVLAGISVVLLMFSFQPTAAESTQSASSEPANGLRTDDFINDKFEEFAELTSEQVLSSSVQELSAMTHIGNIEILESDSDKLQVRAIIRVNPEVVDIKTAPREFDDHVSIQESDGILSLHSTHMDEEEAANAWDVTLIIATPRQLPVTTVTHIGNITVRSASGDVACQAPIGNISVSTQPLDSVTAKTTTGNIEIASATDNTTGASAAGNITLNADRFGSVNLQTLSGNLTIHARQSAGEFNLRSNSGNINLQLEEVNNKITAESFAGNLTLTISSSTAFQYDLLASAGTIIADGFPGVAVQTSASRCSAKGSLGSGGPLVTLHTMAGIVQLVEHATNSNDVGTQ